MRSVHLCLAMVLAPVGLHAQVAGPGAAQYRTFTSTSGKELRARLLAVEGEKGELRVSVGQGLARLRVSDGREFSVPVTSLGVEDQAYIADWDSRERLRASAGGAGEALSRHLEAAGYASAPLKLQGKAIEIEAAVNGRTATMQFDSGRVLTLIDRPFAEQVGIEIHEDIDFGEFRGSDGVVIKVLAGTTKEFVIGGMKIPGFELGVVEFARVGMQGTGVIASDVLQYFDGLVDWQAMRIFLKPQD